MNARTVAAARLGEIAWTAPGKRLYSIDFGDETRLLLGVVNGTSPGRTMLLTGGVHGDEFDGPVVLTELLGSIDPAAVHGRLIVIPVVNPGGLAQRRRTMVDDRDLNRAFPGRAQGSISERVAHVLHDIVIPMADIVYDLHAGGAVHAIVPSVIFNRRATIAEADAAIDAALAFGAPVAIVMLQNGHETMMDGAAERQGKIFGCAELGSFAAITPTSLGIARDGVARLMTHFGLCEVGPSADPSGPRSTTRLLAAVDEACAVIAEDDGLFVPALGLGDQIEPNGVVGQLIQPEDPTRAPSVIRSMLAGEVYAIHAGGPVRNGESIVTIARPVSEEELRTLTRPVGQDQSD